MNILGLRNCYIVKTDEVVLSLDEYLIIVDTNWQRVCNMGTAHARAQVLNMVRECDFRVNSFCSDFRKGY